MNPHRTTRRIPSPPVPSWCLLLLFLSSTTADAASSSHLRRRTYPQNPPASSVRRWLQTAGENAIPANPTSASNETVAPQPEDAPSLDAIESELSALENTDDKSLTDAELEAKMEKEAELLEEEEEALEASSGGWDDDDDSAGDDLLGGVVGVEELQEELEEVEEEIAELDENDDDGESAEYKEAFKEELVDIKNDLEEVIYEGSKVGDDDGYEVYRPGGNSTIKSANMTVAGMDSVILGGPDSLPPNINIDPTLTMDLTQYNSPMDNAPKEAFSAEGGANNMDNEVDRHGVNGTLPGESGIVNEDTAVNAENAASVTAGAGLANEDDNDTPTQITSQESVTKEVASATSSKSVVEKGDDLPSLSNPVKNGTDAGVNKTVSWIDENQNEDILPPPTKPDQSASEEEVKSIVSGTEDDDDDDYIPPQSSPESVTNMTSSAVQDKSGDSPLNLTVPIVGSEVVADTTVSAFQNMSGNSTVISNNVPNITASSVKDSSASELDSSLDSAAPIASSSIANETASTVAVSSANESDSSLNSTLPIGGETSTIDKDIEGDQHDPQVNPIMGAKAGNDTNTTTTSTQAVQVGTEANERDDDDKTENTTVAIPNKSAGSNDNFPEDTIPVGVNATAQNPIHEPEKSTVTPTDTGVAEVNETTESTTASSITATSQTETTSAVAVTSPPALEESVASTQTTSSPTPSPTYFPTKDLEANTSTQKPTYAYVEPTDDSLDPVVSEQNTIENEAFSNGEVSTPTSAGGRDVDDFLREEEEEVKKVGGWMGFAAIVLMIYTAYQMSENPDGICANLCRLVITILGCIVKIILIPFKYILGGGRSSGGQYMATPSYRDPYGSRHMELT